MLSPVRSVAGGILRDQDMLAHAPGSQGPDFSEDIRFLPAAVRTADQRDRAEGVAVGAALSDPYIGGITGGGEHAVVLKIAEVILAAADAVSAQYLVQRVRQGGILVDAEEQIDLRQFLQQGLFIPLGQAAGDHQCAAAAGFFIFAHLDDGVDRFFPGGLNKPAGVDHQDIRLGRVRREDIAPVLQQAQCDFGIHPVFVAAEGNHTDFIRHAGSAPSRPPAASGIGLFLSYITGTKYTMIPPF